MTLDLNRLQPVELVRLLNSTSLGTVLLERQLRRHRSRAGLRLGTDNTIDLYRYAAWVATERLCARTLDPSESYEHKLFCSG